MPRRSQAEILKSYQGKIAAAKRFRREEDYDNTWRRLIDLYRGKHYDTLSTEDRLLVNAAFSTVNVIGPSVAVNYPKITVNARAPQSAPMAIITEEVVNYWWRHFGVRPHFRSAVKDYLVVGHGWMKCGWRTVSAPQVVTEDDDDVPTDVESAVITEDRPFAERVSPFDMFVDPDAISMETVGWIAQRMWRPLGSVRGDERYSPKARDQISQTFGGSDMEESDAVGNRKVRDPNARMVCVWEFYDVANNVMCVFADGCDSFLVKPMEMPYAFGHPFVMLRNYDVPDHFYPIGDLEAIEPLQRELNAIRTQMMNHRKKYARKYVFRKEAFDSDGLTALESDIDNTMVPVTSNDPLTDVVRPFPTETTPPEFYNQSELVQGDIEMVSGVSEYMRGALPEIRRTATEAAITQDAANARAADKLAQIEQAIAAVASRLVQLAQQFMEGEQVVRITKSSEPAWVTFDKDYIRGEFDYEVEGGSTAPVNESFRRQLAMQMVDALAPFVQLGVVNPAALAAHVLEFGFGVKNPQQFLQQPPPPAAPEGDPSGGIPSPAPDPTAMMPPGGMGPGLGGGQVPSVVDPSVLAALASRLGPGVPTLG